MASKLSDIQDLVDRCLALQLSGASKLADSDFKDHEVSKTFYTLCCALADAVSSSSATAQFAAKQLHSLQSDSKSFNKALQQVHDAVCGLSKQSLTRLQTLERLVAHLQATRILAAQDASKTAVPQAPRKAAIDEASSALSELAHIVGAPPQASAASQIQAVHTQLDVLLAILPPGFFDCLLPEGSLNDSQERQAETIFRALMEDYRVRRRILIERVRVTLHSMLWSKEYLVSKGTTQQAAAAAGNALAKLYEDPGVSFSDIFQARIGDVVAITSKATSGDKGKSEATVKSILIGKVPDRGGRPAEGRGAAAAAAMPDWAPRTTSSVRGGRGGHGYRSSGRAGGHEKPHAGRRSRGRVQGGWRGKGGKVDE